MTPEEVEKLKAEALIAAATDPSFITCMDSIEWTIDHLAAQGLLIGRGEADALRAENEALKARIDAAKKRLSEVKAIHTNWYSMPGYNAEPYAQSKMNEIEQIVYSTFCYLDGVPGPYLKALKGENND